MTKPLPTIAVLGASGLIGEATARLLLHEGFPVLAIARRFSSAQTSIFGKTGIECSLVDTNVLDRIFAENEIDIVLNCIGVLQDGYRGSTETVHRVFVERLVAVLGSRDRHALLVHISIPGNGADDRTPFSRSKREAERAIVAGAVPYVILRPGFVIARSAYGGSALMRALALLPMELPRREADQAFMTTDVADIARTVDFAGRRWRDGERRWNEVWEVMARQSSTVGQVIEAFRQHLGGPKLRLRLPSWLMDIAAAAGDLVAHFGWSPPLRTTALQEMRRGVTGDPEPWIAATGIEPASLHETMQRLPSTVQERWFARLYLVKPLVLVVLAVFWIASGLIALAVAFDGATAILRSHGFPPVLAQSVTVVSSLLDLAVGAAIGFRTTCATGLRAGIGISLFYMIGAAVLTPDVWIEPLGALVKTGPAIVLMVVALAMLEDR